MSLLIYFFTPFWPMPLPLLMTNIDQLVNYGRQNHNWRPPKEPVKIEYKND